MRNAAQIEALKEKIRDLRKRMPIHSVRLSILQELEELEEQLDSELSALEKMSTHSGEREDLAIALQPIGVIRTPYRESAPYQPVVEDEGPFRIVVSHEYARALQGLDSFRYIYVLYYLHQVTREVDEVISPPWTNGYEVGLLASRSPVRPNPIGLSIVRLKAIMDNEMHTSGLDVFDGTPLLDVKPYIRDLDSKQDANYGWLDDLGDSSHLALHIHGIPHDY